MRQALSKIKHRVGPGDDGDSWSLADQDGSQLIKSPDDSEEGPMNCERTTAEAIALFRRASHDDSQLAQAERDLLTTDLLMVLALTEKLELSQPDKNRLTPLHLAQLAVTNKIQLTQKDHQRLPPDLLFDLFAEGLVALTDDEIAVFTPEQQAMVEQTEPSVSIVLSNV